MARPWVVKNMAYQKYQKVKSKPSTASLAGPPQHRDHQRVFPTRKSPYRAGSRTDSPPPLTTAGCGTQEELRGIWGEWRDSGSDKGVTCKCEPLCTGKLIPREETGGGSPLCTHPLVHTQTCQQTPGLVVNRRDAATLPLENSAACVPLKIHMWIPHPQCDGVCRWGL